eukprot:2532989-Prorocentrum_lima.AAC.1
MLKWRLQAKKWQRLLRRLLSKGGAEEKSWLRVAGSRSNNTPYTEEGGAPGLFWHALFEQLGQALH